MDAIEIALRANGIGPGDEVITTPLTAFATVLAVLRAGATPVLADIDPDTALLDRRSVASCLSPRTRAVLLVHLYGQLRDPQGWVAFCETRNLLLIEDCAQAHLARSDGRVAGSFGAAGAYGFYPTGNLGAAGDAGMLVCGGSGTSAADGGYGGQGFDFGHGYVAAQGRGWLPADGDAPERVAERARRLRNEGQSERHHHVELGLNSRLDELQAALLQARLPFLEAWTARRRAIAERYRAGLWHGEIRLLAPPVQPETHVHHLFVITTPRRDALQAHLAQAGIQTLCHYPVPVHLQPPCLGIARAAAGLQNAETHAAECLSLPCHPGLSDWDVDQVIQAVNAFPSAQWRLAGF